MNIVKAIVLIIVIFALLVAGMLIFDWLGLMSVRQQLAPIIRLVGLNSPTGESDPNEDVSPTQINDARLRQQLSAIDLERQGLEELRRQLEERSAQLDEREQELLRSEQVLQEQQESLQQQEALYRDRIEKVRSLAQKFNGMPPAQAVAQMNAMDALLVVDVLRAADQIAQETGGNSLVAFWLSQMPADRAAEINRLLVEKP